MTVTLQDLRPLVNKDITFLKKVEEYDWYAEDGMRGTVTDVSWEDESDPNHPVFKLTISFAKFDEYNRARESTNYYDDNGEACLTAREANMYREEDHLYVSNEWQEHFNILGEKDKALFRFYQTDKEANPDLTYVAWLEDIATKALNLQNVVAEAIETLNEREQK